MLHQRRLTAEKRERAREDLRRRLAHHHFSHFITLSANDPMASRGRMRGMLRRWDAEVNHFMLGPRWQSKPDNRLLWYAFLEKPEAHPHWHLLAEIDPAIVPALDEKGLLDDFAWKAEAIWRKVSRRGTARVVDYRDAGAIRYATKMQAREDLLADFVMHLEFLRT